MLVEFIGCPASGKTTTAALVFASLKEMGIAGELIPEQARVYIARLRIERKMSLQDTSLKLVNNDQYNIMVSQLAMEELMVKACGDRVAIITDSSPLNSLFYISGLPDNDTLSIVRQTVSLNPMVFYCPPISDSSQVDPNRIHSRAESLLIDSKIPKILQEFAPEIKPILLTGDPSHRASTVMKHVMEYLMKASPC